MFLLQILFTPLIGALWQEPRWHWINLEVVHHVSHCGIRCCVAHTVKQFFLIQIYFKRHLTRTHHQPRQVTRRLDMKRDSQDGKAICAHCHKSFTNWSSFTFHIQNNICESRQPEISHVQNDPTVTDEQVQPSPRPPSDATELGDRAYAIAQAGDYEMAKEDKHLCNYLTRHCVLCNKFLGSSRAYTSHMRHHRQAALQDAISLGLRRCKQYNAPANSVILNLPGLICALSAPNLLSWRYKTKVHRWSTNATFAPMWLMTALLSRDICREHQFSLFDWKPSRDCLADQQTCAHCGHLFHCMEGLRKHIIYLWTLLEIWPWPCLDQMWWPGHSRPFTSQSAPFPRSLLMLIWRNVWL